MPANDYRACSLFEPSQDRVCKGRLAAAIQWRVEHEECEFQEEYKDAEVGSSENLPKWKSFFWKAQLIAL